MDRELERQYISDPITHTESGRLSLKTPVMLSQEQFDKDSVQTRVVQVMQKSSDHKNLSLQSQANNTRMKQSLQTKGSINGEFG